MTPQTPRERFLTRALGASPDELEAALDEYRDAVYEAVAEAVELSATITAALAPDHPETPIVLGAYRDVAQVIRKQKKVPSADPH